MFGRECKGLAEHCLALFEHLALFGMEFKSKHEAQKLKLASRISVRTQQPEYPSALRDQKSIKRSISVTNIQIYREIFIKSGIFVRILISSVSG